MHGNADVCLSNGDVSLGITVTEPDDGALLFDFDLLTGHEIATISFTYGIEGSDSGGDGIVLPPPLPENII